MNLFIGQGKVITILEKDILPSHAQLSLVEKVLGSKRLLSASC